MSFSDGSSSNVLLLYDGTDDDVRGWGGFIIEALKAHVTVAHMCMDSCQPERAFKGKHYDVIVILVSQEACNIMTQSSGKWDQCLSQNGKVVALTLGLTDDDVNTMIKPSIPSADSWKFLEITGQEEDNEKIIADIVQLVRQSQQSQRMPRVRSAGKRKSIDIRFFPESVRQHDETILMVLLQPLPEGTTVQISVDNKDGPKHEAVRLNQFSFSFKAPDHAAGRAKIYVFVDGSKKFRHSLRYPRPWMDAYMCPQFLCQLLQKEDLRQLDLFLASIYTSSVPHDQALTRMLTPQNILSNTGNIKSSDKLPTLLHFTCQYGLEDLCKNIVESTPGVDHVLGILNCDDKTPADLAEESGHTEMVEYLESYYHLVSYVSNLTEMYVRMGKELKDSDGEDYIKMARGECSYVEGFMPGDDYEFVKGKVKTSGIQEVREEEDVQEVKPAIPARVRKISDATANIESTSPHSATSHPHDPVLPPVLPRRISPATATSPVVDKMDSKQFLQAIDPVNAMSSGMDEVTQLQMAYKRGDLSEEDVLQVYRFYRDLKTSKTAASRETSMKESNMELKKFKEKNAKLMSKVKPKGYRFFSKKKKDPEMKIQHNVQPNQYEYFRDTMGNRNRDSTLSTISTSSSSSCGSRDSGLDPVPECHSSSSDDEQETVEPSRGRKKSLSPPLEEAPPPPVYKKSNFSRSRLPPPPKKKEYETSFSSRPPRPPRR